MATRPTDAAPRSANLSVQQMKTAIPKLERRIAELQKFDPASIQDRSDSRVKALEASIDDALVDIFGNDTVEYKRYQLAKHLDTARWNYAYEVPLHEIQAGFQRGKDNALALFGQAVESFREKLGDSGETAAGHALRAYEGLDFHPEIARAAG